MCTPRGRAYGRTGERATLPFPPLTRRFPPPPPHPTLLSLPLAPSGECREGQGVRHVRSRCHNEPGDGKVFIRAPAGCNLGEEAGRRFGLWAGLGTRS